MLPAGGEWLPVPLHIVAEDELAEKDIWHEFTHDIARVAGLDEMYQLLPGAGACLEATAFSGRERPGVLGITLRDTNEHKCIYEVG